MSEKFFGKYRGQVLNNLDPMRQGRIQIQVPDVSGEEDDNDFMVRASNYADY